MNKEESLWWENAQSNAGTRGATQTSFFTLPAAQLLWLQQARRGPVPEAGQGGRKQRPLVIPPRNQEPCSAPADGERQTQREISSWKPVRPGAGKWDVSVGRALVYIKAGMSSPFLVIRKDGPGTQPWISTDPMENSSRFPWGWLVPMQRRASLCHRQSRTELWTTQQWSSMNYSIKTI